MKTSSQTAEQTAAPLRAVKPIARGPDPDAEMLLGRAHRVLLRYSPGAALPVDLSRVRAMLDAHMFGRDARTFRDDAVETARQIDQVLRARVMHANRR